MRDIGSNMTRTPYGGVVVLIPAWQPDPLLIALAESLIERGIPQVIVVDDGSDEVHRPVFDALEKMRRVSVLRHAINLGKGSALKDGMRFVLAESPEAVGVVTADADGQHKVEDILRVATVLRKSDCFVLGSRRLDGGVPLRSRFGNALTRNVFRLLSGCDIGDTQCGLRGFPRRLMPEILSLPGERYDYEISVLAHLCRLGWPPVEVPTSTIYIDNNRSSHFHPMRDSLRVALALLRFLFHSGREAQKNIV